MLTVLGGLAEFERELIIVASRRGSELQRIAGNDQPFGSAQPFRGKRGRRVRKGDG
jgi:hypothetical protein